MSASAPATLPHAFDAKLLARFYRSMLLDDCVPFWFPRSIDSEHGGFIHCLDADGAVVDTDKSVWAQGRMAWMLLTLHSTVEAKQEYLTWAEAGLKFISDHCFDPSDGRMFFHVQRDGTPIRKRRYAYSESFASIAFAAHHRATGSEHSKAKALELFTFFVKWNFTPGMIPPKYTGHRPAEGMGPRMITIVTAQELRLCLGEHDILTQWIDTCIADIERLFVKPDLQVVMECVAPDGSIIDHFDGRTLNPGHAIEGAWFILAESVHRKSKALQELGLKMLDWMWARGWDEDHGGLFYFRDVYGKPVQEYWQDMKFWWPHDEALIATAMAAAITGDEKYKQWHMKLAAYAFARFQHPKGEWLGYLHRDGSPSSSLKGNMWKSFFHHPRAMMMCMQLCEGM